MIRLFNVCCVPVANSSDMCLISKNTMRMISINDALELLLLDKSINDLTI